MKGESDWVKILIILFISTLSRSFPKTRRKMNKFYYLDHFVTFDVLLAYYFSKGISISLVGNVPDMSRTCPIPWIWAWTGLFRGRGRRLACWVPCPGRVLVSESWVAPDHRPIFYLAKFVWQNKIFFFQSFLLKPALVLVHIIMVCVSTGANCMVWVTKKYACPLVSRTCPVPVLCPLVSTMGTALVPDMSRMCPRCVLDVSRTCARVRPFRGFLDMGREDIPD